MARPSSFQISKAKIVAAFAAAPTKIYSEAELRTVLKDNRESWRLAQSADFANFLAFLKARTQLREYKLRAEAYGREITRYAWAKPSSLALIKAAHARGYFCHATAMGLHGLGAFDQKNFYLNIEQSEKPSPWQPPTQQSIDRAFAGKQRLSKMVYTFDRISTVIVAGKNSGRAGVIEMDQPAFGSVAVTGIERTLIDIAVRPAYAGSIDAIISAYKAAKDRTSPSKLLRLLAKLDYLYPYHQSIGFLLEAAGYPADAYAPFREAGLNFDFYLAHGLKQPHYSEAWRLYYPKDIQLGTRKATVARGTRLRPLG